MNPYQRLFANRVVDENGCWLWTLSKTTKGYGAININQRKVEVHVVAYELFIGPRIPGMHIMHSCDVKHCFNPDHLSEGDIGHNLRDAASKGMMSNRSTNKLTYEKAEEIRQRVKQGESQKELALEFNISSSHISMIVSNQKWKHREKGCG